MAALSEVEGGCNAGSMPPLLHCQSTLKPHPLQGMAFTTFFFFFALAGDHFFPLLLVMSEHLVSQSRQGHGLLVLSS